MKVINLGKIFLSALKGIEKFAGETSLLTGIARIHEVNCNEIHEDSMVHYCAYTVHFHRQDHRLSSTQIAKICEVLNMSLPVTFRNQRL